MKEKQVKMLQLILTAAKYVITLALGFLSHDAIASVTDVL